MNSEARKGRAMSAPLLTQAPAVVIRFELEAAPKVMFECLSESEEKRLRDWLNAHPELAELLLRTLALRHEALAA
jgi:hypothetical protein